MHILLYIKRKKEHHSNKRNSNNNHKNDFSNLQKEICIKLLNVLESLIDSSENLDLQLNCSHALVRWHDREDNNAKRRIKNIMKKEVLNSKIKRNLELAMTPY